MEDLTVDKEQVKKKIDLALNKLKQRRFLVRRSFMCCNGCAAHGILNYKKQHDPKHHKYDAAVYYHKQDYEYWKKKGILDLRYGSLNEEALSELDVGNILFYHLKLSGLSPVWSGKDDEVVQIFFEKVNK
jgi:hypothetical protein